MPLFVSGFFRNFSSSFLYSKEELLLTREERRSIVWFLLKYLAKELATWVLVLFMLKAWLSCKDILSKNVPLEFYLCFYDIERSFYGDKRKLMSFEGDMHLEKDPSCSTYWLRRCTISRLLCIR